MQKRVKEKKPITVQEILTDNEDDEEDAKESTVSAGKASDSIHLNEKEKNKRYLERADVEEAVNIAVDLSSLQNKNKTKAAQFQITQHNMTQNSLPKDLLIKIHDLMVKARVTEERLIHAYKQGLGYFWIGGPGEEAFAVPLGLLINKGQGLNHDWLYLHYRSLPTLMAMGLSMKKAFRTMFNKATDTSSGGRNFVNHYSIPKWNVPPVTSVIENQYSMSIGTAHVLKREPNNQSLVVVTGGDAGTHEGDFATWPDLVLPPGEELPLLITVQNNGWGISTSYNSQHSEQQISQRGAPFHIKNLSINGNDPEESWFVLKDHIAWIRKNRKPVLLEARVSRLYGHSSASGANYVEEECCIKQLEKKLKLKKFLGEKDIQNIWEKYREEAKITQKEVMEEADPEGNTIWEHIYANNENADWRKF